MKYLFSFLVLAIVLFSCSSDDDNGSDVQVLKIVVEYSGDIDSFEGMVLLSADNGAEVLGSENLVVPNVEQNVYSTGYISIDDAQEFYSEGAETFMASFDVGLVDDVAGPLDVYLSANVSFYIDDALIAATSFYVDNSDDGTNYFYYKLDALLGKAYEFDTDAADWDEL
ncbi:MAG: beta-barrel fold lipoprotein [Draconibacterium sp.]